MCLLIVASIVLVAIGFCGAVVITELLDEKNEQRRKKAVDQRRKKAVKGTPQHTYQGDEPEASVRTVFLYHFQATTIDQRAENKDLLNSDEDFVLSDMFDSVENEKNTFLEPTSPLKLDESEVSSFSCQIGSLKDKVLKSTVLMQKHFPVLSLLAKWMEDRLKKEKETNWNTDGFYIFDPGGFK